jgi:hypothetical protein
LLESIRRTASIRALAPFVEASSAAADESEDEDDGDEQSINHDDTVLMLFLSATRFANFLKLAPEVRASGKFDQLLRQRSARWLQTLPLFASFRDAATDKLAVLGDLFRYVELAQVCESHWMGFGIDNDMCSVFSLSAECARDLRSHFESCCSLCLWCLLKCFQSYLIIVCCVQTPALSIAGLIRVRGGRRLGGSQRHCARHVPLDWQCCRLDRRFVFFIFSVLIVSIAFFELYGCGRKEKRYHPVDARRRRVVWRFFGGRPPALQAPPPSSSSL